jgi:hypothetical protein
VPFADFLETPLAEWEEEFKSMNMKLPDKIKLRRLHKENSKGHVPIPTNSVVAAGFFGEREALPTAERASRVPVPADSFALLGDSGRGRCLGDAFSALPSLLKAAAPGPAGVVAAGAADACPANVPDAADACHIRMEPLIRVVNVEIHNDAGLLFFSPFQFQITYDCLSTAGLKEPGTLKNFSSDCLCFLASAEIEWSVTYVSNPNDVHGDQVCSSIFLLMQWKWSTF